MMKRIYLLALIVALLALPVSAEMLTNGSFENITGIYADGWDMWTWGGGWSGFIDESATDFSAYEGTAYAYAGGWEGTSGGVTYTTNPTVGHRYAVSVWTTTENWGDDHNLNINVKWWGDFGGGVTEIMETFPVIVNGPQDLVWRQHSVTTGACPAGTTSGQFELESFGTGTVMYDLASMVAIGVATDPVPADGLGVPTSTDTVSWTNPEALPATTVQSYVSVSTKNDPNTSSLNTFDLNIIADSAGWFTGETINLSALTPSLPLAANQDYYWRVDSRNSSTDGDVVGTVWSFNTFNLPPVVDAGVKQNVWLEGGTVTVDLDGTATDDGLPNPPGALGLSWSGAGATFDPSNEVEDPTATFTTPGTYVLTLTAKDDPTNTDPYREETSDTVTIVVYAEADIDPIAAWPFDVDATEATDPGKDGTLVDDAVIDNVEFQVGGGSVLLDGTDDVVDVLGSGYGTDPNFPTWADINGEVSLTMWVKSSDWQWDWVGMAHKGGTGYRLQRNNNTNTSYFGMGSANQRDVYGSLNVLDEKWHHIAGTYDGETVRLYVDGIFEGSSDASDIPEPFEFNGDNFMIGNGFNGNIDMVRIFDKGLSQKVIRDQFVADGGTSSCKQVYSATDVNQDCYTNLVDVALIAIEWLDCTDISNTAEYGGTCIEQ